MQKVLRVRCDPDIGQKQVPIRLASRYCYQEIAHVSKRLDPVPFGTRQDAEAGRGRLAPAVAPYE